MLNIIRLSILLRILVNMYWFKSLKIKGFKQKSPLAEYELMNDKILDLHQFALMMKFWTSFSSLVKYHHMSNQFKLRLESASYFWELSVRCWIKANNFNASFSIFSRRLSSSNFARRFSSSVSCFTCLGSLLGILGFRPFWIVNNRFGPDCEYIFSQATIWATPVYPNSAATWVCEALFLIAHDATWTLNLGVTFGGLNSVSAPWLVYAATSIWKAAGVFNTERQYAFESIFQQDSL